MTAPLDWSTGQGRVDLRVARLPAADPEKRIGVLMFNPGGPGNGAVGYVTSPVYAEQYFGREILDRFDVVAVDPRGVAGSQGLSCGLPAYDPAVNRFPVDRRGLDVLVGANAQFAESCRELSGPLAEHLDTLSVARDLDLVRGRLGEPKISFLGVSYGTMVGRAYGELFPRRLRALALDAVVDRSLSARQLVLDGAGAVQDGVERFAGWCATQGCGLDVRAALTQILALADRGGLRSDGQPVSAYEVQLGVNAYLQTPLAYPDLVNALSAAQRGEGTGLRAVGMQENQAMYGMYRAIICQDIGTDFVGRLPETGLQLRENAPALRGYSEFWDIASGCAGWPVPPRWQPHPWPASAASALPPTLLLSGTHDVATPPAWAERVHRQLPGSVLLRWDGDGHSAWQLNSRCATDATVRYLVTLAPPADGTVC
ncbi:alpha/beta hydrolase [Micromonospora sp. NPDC049559]|uniref:alpha/beta hydrolase n=1 Tax=Micromonospora sp. NPDC049559 TaxID=3155923 RepID=UPI0034300157